jgi:cytidylate kinase
MMHVCCCLRGFLDRVNHPAGPAKLIIAIDGPAGAGKSSVAKALARRLGVIYLDTGAMYRAVGLLALRAGYSPPLATEDGAAIAALCEGAIDVRPESGTMGILVHGEDVAEAIRSPECSAMASAVSALPDVRRTMVPEQRRLGITHGGVMEGRDMGSVVFPDADVKVFLTASGRARAERRLKELQARGVDTDLDEVLRDQSRRDLQDTTRADSPLSVPRGSVVLDSTRLSLEEVVDRIVDLVAAATGRRGRDADLDRAAVDAIRSRNHGG